MELSSIEEISSREEIMLSQLDRRNSIPPREQILSLPKDFLYYSMVQNINYDNEKEFDKLVDRLQDRLDDEFNKASHLEPKKFKVWIHSLLKQLSIFDSLVDQRVNSLEEEKIEKIFNHVLSEPFVRRVQKTSEMEEFSELCWGELYSKPEIEMFASRGPNRNKIKSRGGLNPNREEIEELMAHIQPNNSENEKVRNNGMVHQKS